MIQIMWHLDETEFIMCVRH